MKIRYFQVEEIRDFQKPENREVFRSFKFHEINFGGTKI